jgi:diadenosine tetraphosphate (Ap4A) HIT family hydrolase
MCTVQRIDLTRRSHFHFHVMPRLTTNLLHEALALLFDLGLHKAPSKNPRTLVFEDRFGGRGSIRHPTTDRTLEERRAALGCFFLVSG